MDFILFPAFPVLPTTETHDKLIPSLCQSRALSSLLALLANLRVRVRAGEICGLRAVVMAAVFLSSPLVTQSAVVIIPSTLRTSPPSSCFTTAAPVEYDVSASQATSLLLKKTAPPALTFYLFNSFPLMNFIHELIRPARPQPLSRLAALFLILTLRSITLREHKLRRMPLRKFP